mgnify:CR=1 FL=1
MQLSTKGRYSLEAMLYLACAGIPQNGMQIQEATGIPFGYLEQLMIPLRKAHLVASVRGAYGGYRLAHTGITCQEVLAASEGGLKLPCRGCKRSGACRTEGFWADLENVIRSTTASITLQDLAAHLPALGKGMGI